MNLRSLRHAALAALTLLVSVAGSVSADITLVERTTFDIRSLLGDGYSGSVLRPANTGVQEIKIYVSGPRSRFETPYLVVISDRDGGKTWVLNVASHKFASRPFDANAIAGVQFGAITAADVALLDVHADVTDTGRSANIMDHAARHYKITIDRKFRGTETVMSSDVLAAQDLPAVDLDAWSEDNINIYGPNVRGVPLLTEIVATGRNAQKTMTRIIATSISSDTVPDNMFKPPSDYTETSEQLLFAR